MSVQKQLWLIVAAMMLVLAGGLSSAQAAKKGGGSKAPAAPAAPSAAQVLLQQDQAAILTAQGEAAKASEAVNVITGKQRVIFEQTSEWKAAVAQLQEAQGALADARKPVIAALASNSEYTAAVADRDKAQSEFEAVKNSPQDATPEGLSEKASALLKANSLVSKIENEALSANPNYSTARDALGAANAAIAALKANFQASLASNADWKAAKDIADAAHQKVLDAQAKLAADRGGAPGGAPSAPTPAAPAASSGN